MVEAAQASELDEKLADPNPVRHGRPRCTLRQLLSRIGTLEPVRARYSHGDRLVFGSLMGVRKVWSVISPAGPTQLERLE